MKNTLYTLGPPGSYSDDAARALVAAGLSGGETEIQYCESNRGALQRLSESPGTHDLAVVPVENVASGAVADTLGFWRELLERQLAGTMPDLPIVVGEIRFPVRHCFATRGTGNVSRAISRIDALNQCQSYLARKGLTPIEASSTSKAAEGAAVLSHLGYGAICSRAAAEIYGLTVIDENIGDSPENATTFHVVSNFPMTPNYGLPATRTALIVALRNEPGLLADALDALRAWNVHPVHAIPTGRADEQRFYLEVAADLLDGEGGAEARSRLGRVAQDVLVLGSYPTLPVS
jgi:prephenate dehydratase